MNKLNIPVWMLLSFIWGALYAQWTDRTVVTIGTLIAAAIAAVLATANLIANAKK